MQVPSSIRMVSRPSSAKVVSPLSTYLWLLSLLDEGVLALGLLALLFPSKVFRAGDLV
jgi:hypothetical protein